MITSLTIFLYI